MPSAETIEAVKEALNSGKTITLICHGVFGGKSGVAEAILPFRNLKHYRSLNPDFDQFVREATTKSRVQAHLRRYPNAGRRHKLIAPRPLMRGPTLTGIIAGPSHEIFTAVDQAVPRNLDFETRKEVMSNMMLAMLEGTLAIEDATRRYREFLRITNRMFPTKYAPPSLDAPAYREGKTRLVETISAGLW
ncbi:hypothetical protein JOE52_002285 [Bradyrhizobium canariense]|nr:hypothetical protein [Bradyrhizobium canariense]